jgi:hypothetical protein
MIPNNLGLFINEEDKRRDEAVKAAFANPGDTEGNLARLGRHWRIDVRFSEPVEVYVNRFRHKVTDRYTFAGFFEKGGRLHYAVRRYRYGTLTGFYAGMVFTSKVVAYDLVPWESSRDGRPFNSFEQFYRRFDRRFITDEKVRELWEGTSSQHGGKYRPSDFHPVGPKGRRVVREFLGKFAGLEATPGPRKDYYETRGETGGMRYDLSVCERAYKSTGRDIKISHLMGHPLVWYSSEYAGCGNGRYGLLATEKTFLWLEDD